MIICTHHTGEPPGILGAQIAATYFTRHLSIPSIVVGLTREFLKEKFLSFVEEHYRGKERIIAFSHLCGRKDILELIRTVQGMGFTTILGGPQALQDYMGEPDAENYPHRFHGLKNRVDIAFQGPVDGAQPEQLTLKGRVFQSEWNKQLFVETDWSNIYTFRERPEHLDVQTAQVLGAIGCPYAKKESAVTLDPPVSLAGTVEKIIVRSCGCVFCDVAWDKGFHGRLDRRSVIVQLRALPEAEGRKIAFELIDEYPVATLQALLNDAEDAGIQLSQVNLVCRVDAVTRHTDALASVLEAARERHIRIMFSSIGFESFSDRILGYLNKGVSVADIVQCVDILRRLKERFGDTLLYRRDEGATHGFIHPTPWDDSETLPEIDQNIFLHRLFEDILPDHSTPLIIHHGSYLGNWIREIEERGGIRFTRDGTWIEWWGC